MLRRYFDFTANDGPQRIAVVEGPSETDIDAVFSLETPPELTADELPPEFDHWRRFKARQRGRCVVDIRSADGL